MGAAQSSLEDEVYRLYDKAGKQLTFAEAVEAMAAHDVVLFGEHHDHALIHWLQLRTAKALHARGGLVLGGEMWESDGQLLLDEYLMGLMNDKTFEDQARLWPNYKTDYKPIMAFAKAEGLRVIATNVPRRYASLVSREGLDTLNRLPMASQLFLPKLPMAFSMETPGYEEMLGMMGGHGMNFKAEYFVQAQALKDAVMAANILRHVKPGSTFLHLNGDFHSAKYGGIYWYIKNQNPNLKTFVIKIFSENSLEFQADWGAEGDLILVVADDFTRTH